MGLDISSSYRSLMQATLVTSIDTVVTFNGSDVSARVSKYGTISHDITDVVGGTFWVEFENNDRVFNSLLTDKTQFFSEGKIEFGFPSDLVQFFAGTLTKVRMREKSATLTFKDILSRLGEKVIGSEESPISFTGSDYNPADLAWILQSSYGNLSSVKSSSNPDVDYGAWLSWWTQFDTDSVVVQGYYKGETVLEALEHIAKATDSVIYDEGDNRLDWARWAGVTSYTHTVNDSYITGRMDVDMTAVEIINKVNVLINYNPSSGTWGGTVTEVNTSSQNSYGEYEETYDNKTVWFVNSLAAINQAQRIVFRRKEPNIRVSIPTPLRYLDAVVGDMVELTTEVYSFDAKLMTLTGYTIDFNKKTMTLEVDEGFGRASGKMQGFILDDAYWGLLDETYNPLF